MNKNNVINKKLNLLLIIAILLISVSVILVACAKPTSTTLSVTGGETPYEKVVNTGDYLKLPPQEKKGYSFLYYTFTTSDGKTLFSDETGNNWRQGEGAYKPYKWENDNARCEVSAVFEPKVYAIYILKTADAEPVFLGNVELNKPMPQISDKSLYTQEDNVFNGCVCIEENGAKREVSIMDAHGSYAAEYANLSTAYFLDDDENKCLLKMCWTARQYNVFLYDWMDSPQGKVAVVVETHTICYNDKIKLSYNKVMEDKVLLGWSVSRGGALAYKVDTEFTLTVKNETSLYAVWHNNPTTPELFMENRKVRAKINGEYFEKANFYYVDNEQDIAFDGDMTSFADGEYTVKSDYSVMDEYGVFCSKRAVLVVNVFTVPSLTVRIENDIPICEGVPTDGKVQYLVDGEKYEDSLCELESGQHEIVAVLDYFNGKEYCFAESEPCAFEVINIDFFAIVDMPLYVRINWTVTSLNSGITCTINYYNNLDEFLLAQNKKTENGYSTLSKSMYLESLDVDADYAEIILTVMGNGKEMVSKTKRIIYKKAN